MYGLGGKPNFFLWFEYWVRYLDGTRFRKPPLSKIRHLMTIRQKRALEWKRFRRVNFFTQARLAEVLGISLRTVKNVECRCVDPHAETLHKFEILKERYARASFSESSFRGRGSQGSVGQDWQQP